LFCSVTNILKNKRATIFKSKDSWSIKNLAKHGVKHVDEPIVIDSNIITCRDEKDSLQLAKTIVEILKSKK
jgi:putative intracellular protease/amidase